ncbi:ABC transporter substrate-binding protein [Halobacteriovorax sp. HLS]|uniref:substrate-binding periplasmic protein n=1 Tax=Halobacteriovorax sp. HLS TaxID=2234000 RepID=UPI000FDC233D|nr:transporter substrate-binding domain-containing protein [Halobacteriovorax sp. HLS]
MIRFLLIYLLFSPLVLSATYKVSITPSCPYYCIDSEFKGYIVEILESYFKSNKDTLKTISTPYARISDSIDKEKVDFGILTALDLRDEVNLTTIKTPLGFRSTGVISRNEDNIVVLENLDLKGKKILLPKGSRATDNIVKEMSRINQGQGSEDLINEVTGSNIHKRLIDLIAIKRGDIALDDYNVMKYNFLKSKHTSALSISPTSLTGHNPILIVTKNNSKIKVILDKQLHLHIKKMRKSGELKSILDKYNLTDWDRTSSR